MKKLITLFVAVLFCSFSFARIWRVNNVAGVAADFVTIQAAHDHASVMDGDTLHLEPSITSYGNLIMTKRLTIISIGNFLSANPGLEYSVVTGTFGNISISNISASGSVFHCNFNGANVTAANNIRFERCVVTDFLNFNNSGSNILMGCYISNSTFTNSNSNVITNNMYTYYLNINANAAATVTNNVFNTQFGAGQTISNSIFQNNIINKASTFTFVNSTVTNNLTSNTTLPAGNGNVNSVNMANVFVNPNGANDVSFVLQTAGANPAVGAGVGGTDAGAYGGLSPFKPGLQAAIPSIYKILAPVAPSGNTMSVTFSTRSNN